MQDDANFEAIQDVILKKELVKLIEYINSYTPKGYLLPIGKFFKVDIDFSLFKTCYEDVARYPEKVFNNVLIAEAIFHFYIAETLECEKVKLIKKIRDVIKTEMNTQNKKICEAVLIKKIKTLQESGMFENGEKGWVVEIIDSISKIY